MRSRCGERASTRTVGRGRFSNSCRFLAERSDCTGRIGVLGFCLGGGFALATATRGFNAASVNYGRLPQDLDDHLLGACPIVGSFGGADRSLIGAAATRDSALERLKIAHDVKEYPGAGHAFLNDTETGPRVLRPVFKRILGADPVAAADAWTRIEAFYGEHLRTPKQSS